MFNAIWAKFEALGAFNEDPLTLNLDPNMIIPQPPAQLLQLCGSINFAPQSLHYAPKAFNFITTALNLAPRALNLAFQTRNFTPSLTYKTYNWLLKPLAELSDYRICILKP